MNHFLESPDNRIKVWREFRKTLTSGLSDMEQLMKVTEFFNCAPESMISIDVDRPSSWPTPWELFYAGEFCPNSLGYLMEQTLIYSECGRWANRVQLVLINDSKYSILRIMVLVDQKFLLNHEYNKVVSWPDVRDNCRILAKYQFQLESKTHSLV